MFVAGTIGAATAWFYSQIRPDDLQGKLFISLSQIQERLIGIYNGLQQAEDAYRIKEGVPNRLRRSEQREELVGNIAALEYDLKSDPDCDELTLNTRKALLDGEKFNLSYLEEEEKFEDERDKNRFFPSSQEY